MRYFFLSILLALSFNALAYTNYIGHGYTSCLNCHYNPFGGGPLNDYGRALSATAISGRLFIPSSVTEEQLAYTSGFLFRKPKQDWLRTQINYRGFQVVNNPGTSTAESKQWINMQFDGRLILKGGKNDKLVAVMNYGYAPLPTQVTADEPEWRSREHYIGYRPTSKVGVYAGLMDKVYGIKVIEHIAYARTLPRATQNDQTHGIAGHYLGEKWEGGAHFFVGNLTQEEDERLKGFSTMFERTVAEIHRLGASFQSASNTFVDLLTYSVHGRFNLKEGSSVLAEFGQAKQVTQNHSDDRSSRYGLLQTYLRPFRGLYFLTNIEYLKNNIELDSYTTRWGPGIQYFPLQRFEFRFDLYNTRNFSPDSSTKDTWMYLFQTHIWL
jgi:hypothetical protein